MSDLSGVLKEVLVYTGKGDRVAKVADLAGVARETVSAQYDKRCNPSVEVVAAAFAVTGDERLRRALTPPGYRIVVDQAQVNPTKPLAEELNDVLPDLGRWAEAIQTKGCDPGEADTLKQELIREIEEAQAAFHQAAGQDRTLKAVGR